MPTISQLPNTAQITAADQIPISQGGSVCSVNVGTLLASTQPAIMIATGSLFGRTSLGPGGPEPVSIGAGLSLEAGSLTATGGDHAGFAVEGGLSLNDQAVVNSSGSPKLLPLSFLRNLFSAGQNVSIDENGTISAAITNVSTAGSPSYGITDLPTVGTLAAGDLVAISQDGTDHAITYANFLDGQTINEVPPAAEASDSDVLPVLQTGSNVVRQTLSALWPWFAGKLSTYQIPSLELISNTTLNPSVHNGCLLVCSQPITLLPPTVLNGTFTATVINASDGSVTLGGGISTSTGGTTLPPGQAANLFCTTYSAGTIAFAWLSEATPNAGLPGEVIGLSTGAVSSNSAALSWSGLTPPPTSYTVQYRVTGTTTWLQIPSVLTTSYTVAGLSPSTSYDFAVYAVNSAGAGSPCAIVTATTATAVSLPGQVAGVTASGTTATSVSLVWSTPSSGGTVTSYTLQYRVSGTSAWSTAATGVAGLTFTVGGLTSGISYDFEVLASNAAGNGPSSAVISATTVAAAASVTSIVWNMVPSGSYTHGSGAIGINAQITPNTAPVQFGFSTSATVSPASWTAGSYVNTNLWGAYVDTPATAGTYYAWAEGLDGSMPTVYPTGFSVT